LKKFKTTIVILLLAVFSCSKEKQSLRAGDRMQDFVISISAYTKTIKPGFIIIPQNGCELAYNGMDAEGGLRMDYLNAIDAITVEELFYNESIITDPYRLNLLQPLKTIKPILVADYLGNDADYNQAVSLNEEQGFLAFPRVHSNYYYNQIPSIVPHENNENITSMDDAKNFLYLLNPENFTSREQYVQSLATTNFDVIIVDLFYEDSPLTAQELMQLKIKNNGSRRLVISYVNIGAAEKYRYYWQKHWALHVPHWLRKKYEGYDDEYYVKFWAKEWQEIIYGNEKSYIKKIIDAGFDGAFLDNVEAYYAIYYND
jgi:cysteinyl-tRNA synthetase